MIDSAQREDGENKAGTVKITWRQLLYAVMPAVLYTGLSSLVYCLLAAAGGQRFSAIFLQAAATFVCLGIFGFLAVQEGIQIRGAKGTAYRYPAAFCYVAAVVMCGVACNQLLSLTGLMQASDGYRHVTEVFYNNSLWEEAAALCVAAPLAEELVYRGFVYQRLRRSGLGISAAVLSAAVFGVLHFNLVQCIYAGVLGLLLAYIVWKMESLAAAAAAHMASNLVSVLWTETGWLDFLNQTGRNFYLITLLCAALTVIFLSYGNQLMRRDGAAGRMC